MAAITRCDCCDLPADSCGKQLENQQRRDAAEERAHRLANGWHEAQYPGRCLRCAEHFPAGTAITSYAQAWACCE